MPLEVLVAIDPAREPSAETRFYLEEAFAEYRLE